MRRGELLRLRWQDVDFERNYISAWSRKQSRQKTFTKRQIDLHPELKTHLMTWQRQRPNGQLVLSEGRAGEPLDVDRANRLFWQPMRKTSWCLSGRRNWFKIGFHTYRHSFASNLAACGVDQRIIDEFMGHQTQEMRLRYRHLFPKAKRSAIVCFSLMAPSSGQPFSRRHVITLLFVSPKRAERLTALARLKDWSACRLELEVKRLRPKRKLGGRRPRQPESRSEAVVQLIASSERWLHRYRTYVSDSRLKDPLRGFGTMANRLRRVQRELTAAIDLAQRRLHH